MIVNMNEEETSDEEDFFDKKHDSKSCASSTNSLVQPLLSSEDSSAYSYSPKSHVSSNLFERNSKLAKFCVMVTVALERAAYYSLLGNLAFYLNSQLGYSSSGSIELTFAFGGITWLSCFVGGLFGDVYFGRFKSIVTGLCLYVLGFVSLLLLTYFAEERGTELIFVLFCHPRIKRVK